MVSLTFQISILFLSGACPTLESRTFGAPKLNPLVKKSWTTPALQHLYQELYPGIILLNKYFNSCFQSEGKNFYIFALYWVPVLAQSCNIRMEFIRFSFIAPYLFSWMVGGHLVHPWHMQRGQGSMGLDGHPGYHLLSIAVLWKSSPRICHVLNCCNIHTLEGHNVQPCGLAKACKNQLLSWEMGTVLSSHFWELFLGRIVAAWLYLQLLIPCNSLYFYQQSKLIWK